MLPCEYSTSLEVFGPNQPHKRVSGRNFGMRALDRTAPMCLDDVRSRAKMAEIALEDEVA
jgi:hypothetical protein